MGLMEQTTVALLLGSDPRKRKRMAKLLAQQERYWQKYLKVRQEMRELTGLHDLRGVR